MGHGN
jgi:hypothetical protein